MPRRAVRLGRRTRRVYVRLNECEFAGLLRLGVLNARCVADEAHAAITHALLTKQACDREFRQYWDAECLRVAKEEMAK